MLASFGSSESITPYVFVDEQWQCRWPRPEKVDARFRVPLAIGRDLRVSLTALRDFDSASATMISKRLWAVVAAHPLGEGPDDAVFVQLDVLLSAWMVTQIGRATCAHLVFQLSQFLEYLLLEPTDVADVSDWAIVLESNDDGDILRRYYLLNQSLCRYNLAGIEATRGEQYYFFGTDKANVNGLPLTNTVCVLNNNTGIICIPVVPPSPGKYNTICTITWF